MEKSKDEQHQRDYKQLKKKNTILEQELQILRHKSSQQKGKSSNGAGVGGGNSRAGEATSSSLQPKGASRPGSQKPRRASVPDPFLPGKLEDDKARQLAEAEAGLKALRKDNQQLVAALAESSAVLVALAERRAEAQGEVTALRAAAAAAAAAASPEAQTEAEEGGAHRAAAAAAARRCRCGGGPLFLRRGRECGGCGK